MLLVLTSTRSTTTTMQVLSAILFLLGSSFRITSAKDVIIPEPPSPVPPDTTHQSGGYDRISRPNNEQDRSVYDVLVSIEDKLQSLARRPTSEVAELHYTLNQIGRRVDAIDAKLSLVENSFELKMHNVLEVLQSRGGDLDRPLAEFNSRMDIALEKILGKISLMEARSLLQSEHAATKTSHFEQRSVDRLEDIKERIIRLEDRNGKFETQWTAQINHINQDISNLQICSNKALDFLLRRYDEGDVPVADGSGRARQQKFDLSEKLKLIDGVPFNFSHQSKTPKLQYALPDAKTAVPDDDQTAVTTPVPSPVAQPTLNNVTNMLDVALKAIEKKFNEIDHDIEIYTRKVFNAYQELLKDSKEIEDYLSKAVDHDNQTRMTVREGFRKIFQHMKPVSSK